MDELDSRPGNLCGYNGSVCESLDAVRQDGLLELERTVASIQIYFEGAKLFLHREGDEASGRSPRTETRGPKRSGVGVLGERQRALSTSYGVWRSGVSSPSVVRGLSSGKFEI